MNTQLKSSKPPSAATIVGIAVATIVLSIAVTNTEAKAAMKMRTRRSGAAAGAAAILSSIDSAGIDYINQAQKSARVRGPMRACVLTEPKSAVKAGANPD